MAYIEKTRDPFHPEVYVCSNCHDSIGVVFVAGGKLRITPFSSDERRFPSLCKKCLEPLEFPKEGLDIEIL